MTGGCLMMGFGYSPAMSEGSLKPPIFLTSTFVFENAQQGKDFFDLTSGRRRPKPGEKARPGLFALQPPQYGNPRGSPRDLGRGREMRRLRQRHGGDRDDLLRLPAPGDTVIHSRPLYGGTETLASRRWNCG
jgi:methionine-gamma-lyase